MEREKGPEKVSTTVWTSHTYSFLTNEPHFPLIDQLEHSRWGIGVMSVFIVGVLEAGRNEKIC